MSNKRKRICIFDPGMGSAPGVPSANLGDVIIQQSVSRIAGAIFDGAEILHVSTHAYPSQRTLEAALACDWILVGGSNIVGSYAYLYREWKLHPHQIWRLRGRAILFGGGWGWYQPRPTLPARWMLNTILSRKHTHSVRDSYTERHLRNLGFSNVLNTACPTLWPLSDRPEVAGRAAASDALLMVTDYRAHPQHDRALIELLFARYQRVHVWLQGRGDEAYLRGLLRQDYERLRVIPHTYDALEAFLATDIGFDYIGTRLHGGIRCLNAGRRALIVAVDNRAIEMASDVGLQTAPRGDLAAVAAWITRSESVTLRLPVEAMRTWSAQFGTLPGAAA